MGVHSDIRSALRAQLLTTPGLPAAQAWENVRFEPTEGRAYFREKLLPNGSTPQTIGDRIRIRHDVLYQVDFFFPLDKGAKAAEGLADALVQATFFPSLVVSANGQTVTVKAAQRAASLQRDTWYQVPVTISAYAFTLNPV